MPNIIFSNRQYLWKDADADVSLQIRRKFLRSGPRGKACFRNVRRADTRASSNRRVG